LIGGWSRRTFVLVGILSLLLLVLVVLILLVLPANRLPRESDAALLESFKPEMIPPKELFLPEEPDFLPLVLLGRTRRTVWTAQDAQAYWIELDSVTQDQISPVIDAMLEAVP